MSFQAKKIKYANTQEQKHWVGDGFNVHPSLRPAKDLNPFISPFILIDYASPREFPKSEKPKGVGEHPHRGFETVTLAYQGEVEHRDSTGAGGVIKPGGVQWMTAGSGIVHDEFHSREFSKRGGTFEMVQLWVNLPKKYKMTNPKYQEIQKSDIPVVELSKETSLRVIAGEYQGVKGPSSTFSQINIFDIKSDSAQELAIRLSSSTNTILLILAGQAKFDKVEYPDKSVLVFEQEGEEVKFKTSPNFKALLLNAQPINEPMVAHGPFVMNTREEISQAIRDFQSGKMGTLQNK